MSRWLLACVLLVPAVAHADKGRDIVEAAAERQQPDASFQIVRMTLVNAKGLERERVFHMYQRRSGQSWDTRIEFKEPADVAGTVLLVLGDDQYLWLPRLQRVRRIAGKARSGAFMGSDFAFEDLEQRDLEQATYKHVGVSTVGDVSCDRVAATPNKGTPSAYGRLETCFSQADQIPVEIRFFDPDGTEAKVLTVDTDSVQKRDGYSIPMKMTMRSMSGHRTDLIIEKLDLTPEIKDSLFDQHSLGSR